MLVQIIEGKIYLYQPLRYKDIIVPEGFIFDGVSVKAPLSFLFSNKDLIQGIRASCLHDYLCQHKDIYSRKYATNILVDVWVEDGLEKWKAWFVRWSVNLYQWLKGWK